MGPCFRNLFKEIGPRNKTKTHDTFQKSERLILPKSTLFTFTIPYSMRNRVGPVGKLQKDFLWVAIEGGKGIAFAHVEDGVPCKE